MNRFSRLKNILRPGGRNSVLPGRIEEQRRCLRDVLSLYHVPERPCKVNDAGKIGTEGGWGREVL